jgi:hypothetical protein
MFCQSEVVILFAMACFQERILFWHSQCSCSQSVTCVHEENLWRSGLGLIRWYPDKEIMVVTDSLGYDGKLTSGESFPLANNEQSREGFQSGRAGTGESPELNCSTSLLSTRNWSSMTLQLCDQSLALAMWIFIWFCLFVYCTGLWPLGFDLSTSHLLGRCSYCLNHSCSPFFWWLLLRSGLPNYLPRTGFELQSSLSLPLE